MKRPIKNPNAKGFTLIELLISVAMIAIIASLAAPSFTTMIATQRIKGLANEIMTDLSFAKMESVQKNQCIAVDFSAQGYTITQLTTCTTTTGATIKTVNNISASNNSFSPSSGTTYLGIKFEPVRTTATITGTDLVISNTNASTRSLKIVANTMGRAEICSPSATITGFKPC
ncbi:GspH/FimT family pseudopilin [Acidovorax soli]|uniref:GspH/FimT family pseudopilin n=1 Tax=Acidovorax soli TaxID=592050 RepID=UPI0032B16284